MRTCTNCNRAFQSGRFCPLCGKPLVIYPQQDTRQRTGQAFARKGEQSDLRLTGYIPASQTPASKSKTQQGRFSLRQAMILMSIFCSVSAVLITLHLTGALHPKEEAMQEAPGVVMEADSDLPDGSTAPGVAAPVLQDTMTPEPIATENLPPRMTAVPDQPAALPESTQPPKSSVDPLENCVWTYDELFSSLEPDLWRDESVLQDDWDSYREAMSSQREKDLWDRVFREADVDFNYVELISSWRYGDFDGNGVTEAFVEIGRFSHDFYLFTDTYYVDDNGVVDLHGSGAGMNSYLIDCSGQKLYVWMACSAARLVSDVYGVSTVNGVSRPYELAISGNCLIFEQDGNLYGAFEIENSENYVIHRLEWNAESGQLVLPSVRPNP